MSYAMESPGLKEVEVNDLSCVMGYLLTHLADLSHPKCAISCKNLQHQPLSDLLKKDSITKNKYLISKVPGHVAA